MLIFRCFRCLALFNTVVVYSTIGAGSVTRQEPAMLLPHEALGNRISELSAHLNAAKSQLLELIAEFDECGGWADEG